MYHGNGNGCVGIRVVGMFVVGLTVGGDEGLFDGLLVGSIVGSVVGLLVGVGLLVASSLFSTTGVFQLVISSNPLAVSTVGSLVG